MPIIPIAANSKTFTRTATQAGTNTANNIKIKLTTSCASIENIPNMYAIKNTEFILKENANAISEKATKKQLIS